MEKDPIIIAIDGYSSCGKSTLAKALAKRLGYVYMDTGAMYRAVSLYIIRHNIPINHLKPKEIKEVLNQIDIQFSWNEKEEKSETYLNGENVENEIRGKEVSEKVSEVAQIKTIRERMVELQRKAGLHKGLVMDGRDIGTKVFPNAELKIFMTADHDIRAKRRYDELIAKGLDVTFEEVKENIKLRDYNDTNRKENPLTQAKDAVVLDNSYLNQEEQLDFVLKLIAER
ncbi:MAG: cytidylate kinase [Flavobacteriales bacterium]|nr:cytidylate kinase [Flavobacteriales bacterium]